MVYGLLADVVVVLHLLWIVFLIFGAVIGRRRKWAKIMHLGGLGFAFMIQFLGWYCPFTYLEVWLRRMHEPAAGYSGSFIIHYIEGLVYIELPPNSVLFMTCIVALCSGWLYLKKPGEKIK